MGVRKIVYKILDILKPLIWLLSMIFRVFIAIIILNRIDELTDTSNIFLGILGMSYILYPLINYLLELHEEEKLRELQSKALKRK